MEQEPSDLSNQDWLRIITKQLDDIIDLQKQLIKSMKGEK